MISKNKQEQLEAFKKQIEGLIKGNDKSMGLNRVLEVLEHTIKMYNSTGMIYNKTNNHLSIALFYITYISENRELLKKKQDLFIDYIHFMYHTNGVEVTNDTYVRGIFYKTTMYIFANGEIIKKRRDGGDHYDMKALAQRLGGI